MRDEDKSKEQLLEELKDLRQQIVALKTAKTSQKQAEEELRQSEISYKEIFNSVTDMIVIQDIDTGEVIDVNDETIRASGFTREELLQGGVTGFSPKSENFSPDKAAQYIMKAAQGEPQCFEWGYINKAGKFHPTEVQIKQAFINGKYCILITARDITKRKQAEKQLAEAMQHLTAHIDNSPLAVVEVDSQFRFIRWSKEAEQVFGWTAEEIIGKAIPEIRWVYEEDEELVRQESAGLLSGEQARSLIINRNYCKDGTVIHCEWYNSGIYDTHGNLISILSLVLDITKRKQVEEQLKTTLKEREVLLKEVYHRVKNNFTAISSLLYLQAEETENLQVKTALEASMHRVKSMASIHEQFYQSDNLAEIDFGEFVYRISVDLFHTYIVGREITLHVDAEQIFLTTEKAIPCALLLNELVSNTLKYAFPDNKTGELFISLHPVNGDTIALQVHDNGVGIPESIDVKNTESLGLQLVMIFVNQLQGSIELKRDQGTKWHIQFMP